MSVGRRGAISKLLSIRNGNVVRIPEEVAAILDPFGNAVHTALSFDLIGEDVLVTGAGSIFITVSMAATRSGARKVAITDMNPELLLLARRMDVIHTVDAPKEDLRDVMARIGMAEGFDVVLELTGAAPAFRHMIEMRNNGGTIASPGVAPTAFEINWSKVILEMINLKGINGREVFETWHRMITFIQGGFDLFGIITQRPRAGLSRRHGGNAGRVVRQDDSGLDLKRKAIPEMRPAGQGLHGCRPFGCPDGFVPASPDSGMP